MSETSQNSHEFSRKQIVIREANLQNEAELEELWKVNCEAFSGLPNEYDFADDQQKAVFIERLKTRAQSKRAAVLVAVESNTIVGMVTLKQNNTVPTEGIITQVRVLPDNQRSGVGKGLMEAIEARAKDYDYSSVLLGTYDVWPKANTFYQKLGYQVKETKPAPDITRRMKNLEAGKTVNEVIYTKQLR